MPRFASLAGFAALLLSPPLAHAATINVACSVPALVSALNTANSNAQANTLVLATGCTYTLVSVSNTASDGSANGLPGMTSGSNLTVKGNGAVIERSPVASTPRFRILAFGDPNTPPALGTVEFDDLTIRNGADSTDHAEGGGMLFAAGSGTLILKNVTMIGNYAAYGGALAAVNANVTISNSAFNDNRALFYSAGLLLGGMAASVSIDHTSVAGNVQDPDGNQVDLFSGGAGIGCLFCGSFAIADSVVSGNSGKGLGGGGIGLLGSNATIARSRVNGNTIGVPTNISSSLNGVEFGSGGGIASGGNALVPPNSLQVNDSAIYQNSAATSAGGIGIASTVTAAIANTTISSNVAGSRGGGVGDAATSVSLVGATIAANNAPRGAGVDIGRYTDLNNNTTVGSASFANTIVGANTGATDCYNDSGSVASNASSLLQTDASAANACDGAGGTHFALRADPKLSPLQNNGGADLSHVPLAASPAIDAGNNALIPGGTADDERGNGYRRIVGAAVDMGAIESGNNDVIFGNGFEIR